MLSQIKSAFNNQFVSADNQGASPLVANRGTAQEWETFNVINNSDGTISFQAVANNKYVTADLNQETKLIARATEIQAWEKFRKIDRGNGKMALQAVANNLYVSADLNNGAVLYANRPSASGPDLVAQDSSVAWKTGLWFWNTQTGAGTMTCHDAMVHSRGFGETIRTINGALECNRGGGGPVQSRVEQYKRISGILGVDPGNNLSC
jgi:Chitinase class I